MPVAQPHSGAGEARKGGVHRVLAQDGAVDGVAGVGGTRADPAGEVQGEGTSGAVRDCGLML